MSEEKKATYGQIFWSWKTYWYSFVFVTLISRGEFIHCLRIGDYSGAFTWVFINPLFVTPIVAATRWNWQKPRTATAAKQITECRGTVPGGKREAPRP